MSDSARGTHDPAVVRKSTTKGNEVVAVASFKFMRLGKPAEARPRQDEELPEDDAGLQGKNSTQLEAPMLEPRTEQADLQQAGTSAANSPSGSPSAKELILPDAGPSPPPTTARIEEPEAEEEQAEQRPARRERDLNADVAGLLAFIPAECPTAVSVIWVLTEALRIAVDSGDEQGKAAAQAVLQSFQRGLEQQVAAARRLLQGGPEQIRMYDDVPAMVRELCAGEPLVASLRQQLAALEQEEAAWRSLEEKYRDSAAAAASISGMHGAAQGAAPLATGSDRAGDEGVVQKADLEALSAAQRRADVQLDFQVQCINSMLDKAERLVDQAQQACLILQADYHKENFQSYAHVNSPQVLVKILSQAAPPPGIDYVPASQPSQC